MTGFGARHCTIPPDLPVGCQGGRRAIARGPLQRAIFTGKRLSQVAGDQRSSLRYADCETEYHESKSPSSDARGDVPACRSPLFAS